MSEANSFLNAIEIGGAKSADELLPLVYQELRRLAASKMACEALGHTLQPTALVHEAWLRLAGSSNPKFANTAHFFAAAAETMRRILIDQARSKGALCHGGTYQRVDMNEVNEPFTSDNDEMMAVNEALDKLSEHHPLEAEVVKLRYFTGMTNDEAAQALGISPRTAKYYWTHARAWLYHAITTGTPP